MKTILAAALLLLPQASPLDDFYKFKPGTEWTYQRIEGDSERKIVGKVTGNDASGVRVDWKDLEKDGSLHEASLITWSLKGGVLVVEAKKDGDAEGLSFAVLKDGAKKDETWDSPGGKTAFVGKMDVKVPAGTYKDAVVTRFKFDDENTDAKVDFYLVPKVGLVKIDIIVKGGGTNHFELTEFKPAK